MEQVTQEQLEATCREWQKRLRLQDWNVRPEWKRANEAGENLAMIYPRIDHKSADMWVVRPEDFEEDRTYSRDWEHHIVHELLHLHWHFLGTEHPQKDLIEQAVELTAQALVAAKREKPDGEGEEQGDG